MYIIPIKANLKHITPNQHSIALQWILTHNILKSGMGLWYQTWWVDISSSSKNKISTSLYCFMIFQVSYSMSKLLIPYDQLFGCQLLPSTENSLSHEIKRQFQYPSLIYLLVPVSVQRNARIFVACHNIPLNH